MEKRHILIGTVLIIGGLLIGACGAAGPSGPGTLTLKYPDVNNQELPLKSGGFYTSTKTWTKPDKKSTSGSYFICVADYDIDMKQGAISIGGAVQEGQTKVCFSLDGAEGTDDKTPPATGTFPMGKSGPDFAFNSISSASIRTFKDGKEIKHFLNSPKTTGELKITSASAEAVSGEINLSDGEKEIKGTFSAAAYKRE